MKILASDYDGTLRVGEFVSAEDVMAIQKFRKAGNLFGIVTGRSMESLQFEIDQNQLEYDFIITNNGGVVYDGVGTLLECHYMNFDRSLDIIAYIKTLDCASFVINDGYHRFKINVNDTQIDHKYAQMPNMENSEEEVLDRGKIAQLVISLNDSMLADEIARHINVNFKGYANAYVNVNCVDIVPDGISKAEGIFYMEDHLSLRHEDIYAIGDSFNDVPMLEEFHGCTLSHARTIIKEQADHVFDNVSDCIAFIMKRS